MLGLEIERALDAQQPRVEQPLGCRCEPLDDLEQRVDRVRLDLVARAPHEMQRLCRDVAIRAGDRRGRLGCLGDVLDERDAEREHGTRRVRVAILRGWRQGGPPFLRERVGRRERAVVGTSESREDRRGRRLDGGQRGDQIGDPVRIERDRLGVAERTLDRRRVEAGDEIGEVACGHLRESLRAAVEPALDHAIPVGGGTDRGEPEQAVDLGLVATLAAAELDDLDLIERLLEAVREDQRARGREPALAVAEHAATFEPGAVLVGDLGLILATDRDQRIDHDHRVFVVGDPPAR